METVFYNFIVSGAGRTISAVCGLLLLIWLIRSLILRRSDAALILVTGALVLGLLLLAGAAFPAVWLRLLNLPHLARIRLLMAGVSLLVLLVAFESIRRGLLRERYALLWIATGGLILLCAIMPDTLGWLSRTFGMQYVTTVVAVVFTFLILVAFHFSLALSRSESDLSKIAQRCAQLEARLELLERHIKTGIDQSDKSDPLSEQDSHKPDT